MLSVIKRPGINALWVLEITLSITSFSLFASTLDINLYSTLHRELGPRSTIVSGHFFFEIRIMFASGKFLWNTPVSKNFLNQLNSVLPCYVPEFLKNLVLIPSGPAALSGCTWNSAFLTSIFSRGRDMASLCSEIIDGDIHSSTSSHSFEAQKRVSKYLIIISCIPLFQSTTLLFSSFRYLMWLFFRLVFFAAWKYLISWSPSLNYSCLQLCFQNTSCWVNVSCSCLDIFWWIFIDASSLRPLVYLIIFLLCLMRRLKSSVISLPRVAKFAAQYKIFVWKVLCLFTSQTSSNTFARGLLEPCILNEEHFVMYHLNICTWI